MSNQPDKNVATAILTWPKGFRVVLGLFLASVVGWYLPLLTVTLTGTWINNLGMWKEAVGGCLFLVIMNFIGYAIGRPWLSAAIFIAVIEGYEIQHLMRLTVHWGFSDAWQLFFIPLTGIPLSAWVFTRFGAIAGLGIRRGPQA